MVEPGCQGEEHTVNYDSRRQRPTLTFARQQNRDLTPIVRPTSRAGAAISMFAIASGVPIDPLTASPWLF